MMPPSRIVSSDSAGPSDLNTPIRLSLYRNITGQVLILGVAIFFLLFAAKYFYYVWNNLRVGNIKLNDFLAILTCAQFPTNHRPSDIYNRAIIDAFQEANGASQHYPCPYPPSFVLFMMPIGLMDFYPAYAVWMLGTFVFYLIISWRRNLPCSALLLILFAPATALTFAFGQTGFLTSGLMIGGFRLIASRPALSGVLFGLLSIKPQLGILIPIALISARLWRTLLAAGLTVLAFFLASSAAFGWEIWPLWLSQLLTHADWVAATKPQFMPTIIANLTFLHIDLQVARGVQLVVAVTIAGTIWACFRRGPTTLGGAALIVGTFLATPYAFVYDMPVLTNAVLAVVHDQQQMHRRLVVPAAFILVWSLALPALMVETWRPGAVKTIPLILLFGLIVWYMFGGRRDTDQAGPLRSERMSETADEGSAHTVSSPPGRLDFWQAESGH